MSYYRPHPKDGEGNVFSLSTLGGGQGGRSGPAGRGVGVRSSWGGQVQLLGGVRSSCWGGGQVQLAGGVRSSWRGGSVQLGGGQSAGGVSILRPLAGGMPLAFTQEDFLVV